MSLPKIAENGRLVADPELRFTPSGKAVANVTVAFNKSRKTDTGEWEQVAALFVRGSVWGDAAEQVTESLQKGDEVTVVGELSEREFTDRDGNQRKAVEANWFSIAPVIRKHPVKVQRAERATASTATSGSSDEPPF